MQTEDIIKYVTPKTYTIIMGIVIILQIINAIFNPSYFSLGAVGVNIGLWAGTFPWFWLASKGALK